MDGDRGVPNEVTYTFSRGDYEYFAIDSDTGQVSIGKLINREDPKVLEKSGVMEITVLVSIVMADYYYKEEPVCMCLILLSGIILGRVLRVFSHINSQIRAQRPQMRNIDTLILKKSHWQRPNAIFQWMRLRTGQSHYVFVTLNMIT